MPTNHSLNHVFIASLTKYRWSMVSSVAQNSHQGLLQVGFPTKQTLRLILVCKRLLESAFGINILEGKAKRQHWAEGQGKPSWRAKGNLSLPSGGVSLIGSPFTADLYCYEKAVILQPLSPSIRGYWPPQGKNVVLGKAILCSWDNPPKNWSLRAACQRPSQMQGGLSLVPAVRSGHHIPAASTKTWTLHHSLPPSSAYCPLSSKDLLVFIRYLPSSKYDISTQEQTKQRGSKGTIISHYSFSYQKKKKKSFWKGLPEKFSLHGAKTPSRCVIQKDQRMNCWVVLWT